MNVKYSNVYGSLELRTMTPIMPIRDIKAIPECMFNVRTAEQIALITGNRGVQLSFKMPLTAPNPAYVIVHSTPNSGAVAKVVNLEFTSTTEAEDILSYYTPYYTSGHRHGFTG